MANALKHKKLLYILSIEELLGLYTAQKLLYILSTEELLSLYTAQKLKEPFRL
jgi:hypothetical protein